MAEAIDTRVALHIDFDNIAISQYDKVHGRSAFMNEKSLGYRSHTDFVEPRDGAAELPEDGLNRRVRPRDRG